MFSILPARSVYSAGPKNWQYVNLIEVTRLNNDPAKRSFYHQQVDGLPPGGTREKLALNGGLAVQMGGKAAYCESLKGCQPHIGQAAVDTYALHPLDAESCGNARAMPSVKQPTPIRLRSTEYLS